MRRLIVPSDLPLAYATPSDSNGPSVVARVAGAAPRVPAGFTAELWAVGFRIPRVMRVAPNGDVFLAETGADRVRVLRAPDGAAHPSQTTVFAGGLSEPFGIAFWPQANPRYVYVAEVDRVVRFPYVAGDLQARGPAEVIVPHLAEGGHSTRDLAVAPDGMHLFVSIGSASNAGTSIPAEPPVGGRAVKPLLDALSDPDVGQQKVAIDVLSYIENKNAGPALFSYATQGSGSAQTQAPLTLRTRAMIACGALKDDALLPRYGALLFPKAKDEGVPTDAVATAAAWGVAKLEDARALPLLRKLLDQGTPEMRAFAALGVAAAHDRSAVPALVNLAKAADAGNVARAAAAYALGQLDAQAATPTLLLLAQGSDALPRETALLALAQMARTTDSPATSTDPAVLAMADALFAEADGAGLHGQKTASAVRNAAAAALTTMAARARGSAWAKRTIDPLPMPDDPLDADETLRALVPTTLPADDRLAALQMYQRAIAQAGRTALRASRERATAVLDALGSGGDGGEGGNGGAQLAPLVLATSSSVSSASDRAALQAITETLEPGILPLVNHPDEETRIRALGAIAGSTSAAAENARVGALADSSEAVRRVAIGSIGLRPSSNASASASAQAVAKVLANDSSWAMRVLSAEALGRMGAATPDAKTIEAASLTKAATDDSFALVREAALEALVAVDPSSARTPCLGATDARSRAARPRDRRAPRSHEMSPRVARSARHIGRAVLAVSMLLALASCRELDRFTTHGDHFEGTVVAADFVRTGIAPGTRMCLVLDADRMETGPGTFTTSDGLFQTTALRPIPQLLNDPLSNLSFGDGHIQNFIYSAHPNELAAAGGDVMTVLALLQSDDVEIRLLRGAPEIDPRRACHHHRRRRRARRPLQRLHLRRLPPHAEARDRARSRHRILVRRDGRRGHPAR